MTPALAVEDLHVSYGVPGGVVRAVRGVSFSVQTGERFGIVGESGCGKSTLALALLRVLGPTASIDHGRILLDGRDLLRMGGKELRDARWRRIALVPQGSLHALNPVLRVEHQVIDALEAHGIGRGPARRRVAVVLEMVGLPASVARSYPHELSGGMRQRVCVAMAVALGPSVLVADEPTSALDVVAQRLVVETILRVQSGLETALVLIGHDLALQAQVVDRLAVMHRGRIIEEGPVRSIFKAPVHGYTQRLLAAVPSIRSGKRFGVSVARPPIDWSRCAAPDSCREGIERHELGPGHFVICGTAVAAGEPVHV